MRKLVVPGLAALILAGCSNGSQQSDLRCYAASMAASKARPNDQNLIVMSAYYMGRLDAADADGKWTQSFAGTMRDVQAEADGFEALFTACVAPLRASLERQQAAVNSGDGT